MEAIYFLIGGIVVVCLRILPFVFSLARGASRLRGEHYSYIEADSIPFVLVLSHRSR